MRRSIGFCAIVIIMAILTSCNVLEPRDATELNGEEIPISPPNLNTEQEVKEYLKGEWIYDFYYRGDVICKMDIDEELNIYLSFENSYSAGPVGDYSGKITLDRIYSNSEEAPDLICLELMETDEPGGDFYFLHRTIYDGKRVMSWFFAGNGNSVFDVVDVTGGFRNVAEEIIFEKITGETSQEVSRKNDEFYAVYWGMESDNKSIWLDDVCWIPLEEDDYAPLYPRRMTLYETDIAESVLYNINPDEISEILGDDLTEGAVYFVQTDEKGDINNFIDAERKNWLESECVSYEVEALIYDIIDNDVGEIKNYLNAGMTLLLTGKTTIVDDYECYDIALGTNHEDTFVREIHYAVNIVTRQVYKFDVLNDMWEILES